MTRDIIGRVLCFALGALYTAGAVPLFTFGPTGKHLWSQVELLVAQFATAIGIAPWLATWLLGFLAIGGPWALVWLVAGNKVRRWRWMLAGVAAYGVFWLVT